jgi:Trypsin
VADETQLLLALDMLTEGAAAEVPEALRKEALAAHRAARRWTRGKGIQGLGIGEKITDGAKLDQLVLKIYVDRKKPRTRVKNVVPERFTLPGLAVEIPTDVEEIGVVKLEANTARVRPALAGCSVAVGKSASGTFGCLVHKRGDDRPLYVLSNSHVLADEGTGTVGDKILQPGKLDGGKAAKDVLAELTEWVPFEFSAAGFPNLVDAAIAQVQEAKSVTSVIRLIGLPIGVSRIVQRNMQVQKTGRSTDYTIGIIKDVNFRTALTCKKPGGGKGRVGFWDQVLCTRFTADGDSGSAVLNMRKEVVGLHFAGSDSASIFNRIGHVLDALHIDVVTGTIERAD